MTATLAVVAVGQLGVPAERVAETVREAGGELTAVATVAELVAAARRLRPEVVLIDPAAAPREELIDAVTGPGLEGAALLAVLPEVTLAGALRAAALGAHDFLLADTFRELGPDYLRAAGVPASGGAPSRQRKVLLVDAHSGRAHWLSFILLRAGFDVLRAGDCDEALKLLEDSQGEDAVDLVVVDFDTSQFDPASFLALAGERLAAPAPTGIAMLDAATRPETAAAALASGYRHLYHTRRPPDELVFLANESTQRDHGQHRAAPRFACAALVRFREAGGPWRHGLSYNISVSGLYVRTILPPPAEAVVELEIEPPGAGTITTRARVAWCWPFAARANRTVPTGMGLKLCEPDLAVQRAMAIFVLQLGGAGD